MHHELRISNYRDTELFAFEVFQVDHSLSIITFIR
jgi:hypothetical protein